MLWSQVCGRACLHRAVSLITEPKVVSVTRLQNEVGTKDHYKMWHVTNWQHILHIEPPYEWFLRVGLGGTFLSNQKCALRLFGYFVTTRMGATRIGFARPAGFDLGLRNSGVHISGPELEISRPESLFAP